VVDDDRRYVYRLVGTREVAMRGKDPTGQSMIEGFFAPNLEAAADRASEVLAGGGALGVLETLRRIAPRQTPSS